MWLGGKSVMAVLSSVCIWQNFGGPIYSWALSSMWQGPMLNFKFRDFLNYWEENKIWYYEDLEIFVSLSGLRLSFIELTALFSKNK